MQMEGTLLALLKQTHPFLLRTHFLGVGVGLHGAVFGSGRRQLEARVVQVEEQVEWPRNGRLRELLFDPQRKGAFFYSSDSSLILSGKMLFHRNRFAMPV